jgi:hypothetical protein
MFNDNGSPAPHKKATHRVRNAALHTGRTKAEMAISLRAGIQPLMQLVHLTSGLTKVHIHVDVL